MSDLQHANDYGEREAQAACSVLIEVGQVLGAYRRNFVVVGGSVPAMLLEGGTPKHIGTLDIDIDLDPEALNEGEYANLVESLVSAGYERDVDGLKAFQLRRWVTVDEGDPIAVIIDLLMPRNAQTKKNQPLLIAGLRVQGIDGGDIALKHYVEVPLEGTMPDGRSNRVNIRVASIPALLVMKGYALDQRDKSKDAYDIWYCVRCYEGGIESLAVDCRPLLEDDIALVAWKNIANKFRTDDDFGPVTVRRFLENSDMLGEMTPEQVQTDAFMQVRAWLRELGLFEGDSG